MDGYEATRRIKSDPELKSIPIIAVTSYALSGDDGKAHAAGCDCHKTLQRARTAGKDSSIPAISRCVRRDNNVVMLGLPAG
jgi:CheY-like chemotaxis protein